jgi:UDP-N-acetylmuramate: L-alanyl-gamma-D-glutamyl-meso-diaminopimelate ligase
MHIHFVAIGGTGMAPLACLLKQDGHHVTGSDGPLYPPMSTLLERAGIVPFSGFDPGHLEPRPHLAIIGNVVSRANVEAAEVERLGIPRLSMPEALTRFYLADRRPLVVAGTHGKTTTTAMAAWIFQQSGGDPGYLVGGVPRDLPTSFHRGGGARFIIEGDEYNAAYFDRGAKFLHYRPETLILTSVEYDHADLYPSQEAMEEAYEKLIDLLPPSGLLVACGKSHAVRRLARGAACRVVFYGISRENDVHPEGPIDQSAAGMRFRLADPEFGPLDFFLPLWGEHNALNALAVWCAARRDGLDPTLVRDAMARFRGVRRRLEVVGERGGVTVVDDFAHHPTAVGATLRGLRARYPGRRVIVLFEPRSNTAGRAIFFEPYVEAFAQAEMVRFAPIFHAGRLSDAERLDLPRLCARLAELGTDAAPCSGIDEVVGEAVLGARRGDVVIAMSSGAFGNAPRRVLEGLPAGDGE